MKRILRHRGVLFDSSIQYVLRVGSDWAKVERRSIPFLAQTMTRGETFGLKMYIKIIHLKSLAGHSVKAQRRSPKAKTYEPNI